MTWRTLVMSVFLFLLPAAARAEPGDNPFSLWIGYGPSSVSREGETRLVDDISLGGEYGWRFAGDFAVVMSAELTGLHFATSADMPARGGFTFGAALRYDGPVSASIGAEGGVGYGYPWDTRSIDDLKDEPMWLAIEFVRAQIPLVSVGSFRLGLSAQVQAREYGDGIFSLSGLFGIALTN
jgi:hypothetical protein